ncbi:MAG TPA: gfo/Idh/MocA family oxidoreductase, partial [Candidatus Hydrogenedentes bacterium]|nr:gfo/Idh/MocA family oxidoreductase [Candidatus Hydrogenedentota bacterium]
MSNHLNRRQFLGRTMASGAVLTAGLKAAAQAETSADPVVVGVVGMNRGKALALDFLKAPGCRIKYVCDVDQNRLAEGRDTIGKAGGTVPEGVTDFRRILDDPEVEAMAFALPIHWHAPAAIL